MALNGAEGCSAGVCAWLVKAARDKNASPMIEPRSNFILYLYFATPDKSSASDQSTSGIGLTITTPLATEPNALGLP